MPFFRTGTQLVYYAHVPKCGGSTVADYINKRFGGLAFSDNRYYMIDEKERWSKTSPQHINLSALDRLFPENFFDRSFAIVRHPVARVVSAFHFQKEVERKINDISFGDWLETLPDNPRYAFDNHLLSMDEIVPPEAEIFHLEHGLDALIPWFDRITGEKSGPRVLPHVNKRGDYRSVSTEKVKPSQAEIRLITELYHIDFDRFGYDPDLSQPLAAAPELSDEYLADREQALAEQARPKNRLMSNLRQTKRMISTRIAREFDGKS
ncbi:sulfotransferase family 2 domain-containing protein [Ruegeria sp. HKCCD7255]|uniref:sulfotransferase family 2 domain-containing protein n=1 Tax=Ruegeria sp. HKCCD7255 TaxID=2683004 RepID=UPI001487940F|nr:sulfotransferase family 2 domain-containing protein [Ruegeria sp. HKCCD7255]